MARFSRKLEFESHDARPMPFFVFVSLLVGWALPRAVLPDGISLAGSAGAWALFVSSLLLAPGPLRLACALGAGFLLVALAALAPPLWLAMGASLLIAGLAAAKRGALREGGISFGLGILCPALFYAAIFAAGADQRTALKLAFRVNEPAFGLLGTCFALGLLIAVTLTLLAEMRSDAEHTKVRVYGLLAIATLGVLALRLVHIASVATLRTDLMIWSEPPALVNLLKLANHEPFYGPMAQANSYSYSPGLELTQYVLLRPFGLSLSLRAHRVLGIIWQLGSGVVLSGALWPWLRAGLARSLGMLGYPTLLLALLSVTLSSLLAPHVHPDHLLLLCFCGAIYLCVEPHPFRRGQWVALAALPILATVFKLTGAGLGFGLVLAVLSERRWPALWVLIGSGALALLTIPLFDATLGQFSAYAIRLQASHVMEWSRIRGVPQTTSGLMFEVACAAWIVSRSAGVPAANWRAAGRVLALTLGLGSTSLVAFLKHGGRENSLMPFALGAIAALLILLGAAPEKSQSAKSAQPAAAEAIPVVLFWAALTASWPVAPIDGVVRESLSRAHEREIAFLRESFAAGKRPWSQGTSAWIDAGRRDVPLDRLSSVSELELAHSPELRDFETRFLGGEYDALFVSARALTDNPLLGRLHPRLAKTYTATETQLPGSGTGYVILERRH